MYTMYTSVQHHKLGTLVLYYATYREIDRLTDREKDREIERGHVIKPGMETEMKQNEMK